MCVAQKIAGLMTSNTQWGSCELRRGLELKPGLHRAAENTARRTQRWGVTISVKENT